MSIIDSALHRLGGSKTSDVVVDEKLPPPVNSLNADLLFVAGRRPAQRPLALWLGVAFLALGVAVYFMSPRSQPHIEASRVVVPTPAPTPAVPVAAVAPATPIAPIADIEAARPLTAVEIAPSVPASVQVAETSPLPVVKPPSATVLASTPAPAPAPVAAAVAPTPPVQLPKPLEKPGQTEKVAKLEKAEPVEKKAAPSLPVSEPHPAWLMDGWAAIDAGNPTKAYALWEAGLLALPDDRRMIVAHAYRESRALDAAFHRRTPGWAAFGFREGGGGSPLYRFAILAPKSGLQEVQAAVGTRYGRADVVSASYLKGRVSRATPAVNVEKVGTERMAAVKGAGTDKAGDKIGTGTTAGKAPVAVAREAKPGEITGVAAPSPAQEASYEAARRWEGRAEVVRGQLRAGSYAATVEASEALARDFPDRWEPWYWLGTAQLARGQLAAAEIALDRALKNNGKVAQVWIQRAVAAQERFDHLAAIGFLNEALALAPRIPEIHLNLGFSYDTLGKKPEAEKNFRNFLVMTEGNAAYAVQRKHILDRLNHQ